MNDLAMQLRAQIPFSTDPERLERLAMAAEGKQPRKAYWVARGANLECNGLTVAYLMRQSLSLPETKNLCRLIAAVLNESEVSA